MYACSFYWILLQCLPPTPPPWPASPLSLPGGPAAGPAHAQQHAGAPSPTHTEGQEEIDRVRTYRTHRENIALIEK